MTDPTSNEELKEVERRLNAASEAELRRLLAEGADPELERRAIAGFERVMAGPRRRPARPGPRFLVGTAAALLLAALGWLSWGRLRAGAVDPRSPGNPVLGSADEALLRPRGAVEEYAPFEWRGEPVPGGWFRLRIWDGRAPEHAEALFTEEGVRSPWTPERDLGLPETIRWEVRSIGPDRELVWDAEAESSRRSP